MVDSPAITAALALGLAHEVVTYGRVSSAEEAAAARGIGLDQLIKTLVVRRAESDYVFVLIPGDRAIDWPKLRTALGVSRLSLPDAEEARAATGYERGTITPLGASHPWPVFMDQRLLEPSVVSIGAGKHGAAINCAPTDLADQTAAATGDFTKKILSP